MENDREMATHPMGPGMVRVNLAVPEEILEPLLKLAEKSELSKNLYCAEVLKDAVDTGALVETKTILIRKGKSRLKQTTSGGLAKAKAERDANNAVGTLTGKKR